MNEEHPTVGGAAASRPHLDRAQPGQAAQGQTRLGRARFGGGLAALVIGSLACGVVLAGGLGWLFSVLVTPESRVVGFVVFTAMTLPFLAMLGWALLVDRSTIAGALDRPEESIESVWYEKAASGAFGDILLVGGIGAVGFSVLQVEAPVMVILAAVLVFAMLDFAARYLWQKTRAS